MSRPAVLAVTAGDPAGIGPEIVAKALSGGRLGELGRVVVYAEPTLFDEACRAAGLDPLPRTESARESGAVLHPVSPSPVPADFAVGSPSAFTGAVAAACVREAATAAMSGAADAVVTAPLAKSALRAAGVSHPGHTEMLSELAGGVPVAMMFVAPDLRVTLATIHVPLADVPGLLTAEEIAAKIRMTGEALRSRAGIAGPRIAVLGVNPHAGEGGLFGDEDERIVAPAVAAARAEGWSVEGPFPADSFFLRHRGDHDAVIAMYHDQGLIPVKLLARGRAVNVTLGLPFLRTSVDHGTAFDIAGKGVADEESLLEAARLAAEWTRPRG
ncbi:MAG TPA: 4-hydroxythreonine-4-phosphate dehydrogenase PdxA [bacterium]|nr:4-hydroxythreonine-4-phosphate dehydrogenase PdxA [bacterium]